MGLLIALLVSPAASLLKLVLTVGGLSKAAARRNKVPSYLGWKHYTVTKTRRRYFR